MTQLKAEDMDETYTFNTFYVTREGKKIYHEIARKGNNFYQRLGNSWMHAPSDAYCKEIFDLKNRIMEMV